jgi:hypothetical protein
LEKERVADEKRAQELEEKAAKLAAERDAQRNN